MGKRLDAVAVLVAPLLSFVCLFFLGFRAPYIGAMVLFFVIPAAYLSFRNPERVRKVGIFTLLAALPMAFIIDILSVLDRAWVVPATVFPFRILGFMPVEDFVWMVLVTYLAIMLYENFAARKFNPGIGRRVGLMCAVLYPIAGLVVVLFLLAPSVVTIPYAFLFFGVALLLVPALLFLLRYRSYAADFLKAQALFFCVHLPFELVGIKQRYWVYSGSHYLGWLHILGVGMPVEEMVFVMLTGALAACAYYVFFCDPKLR